MWSFLKSGVRSGLSGSAKAKVSRRDRMMRVSNPKFFGRYSLSPNGCFTLGWSDSDQNAGVGGFREKGNGAYILLENDTVLLQGQIPRPNSGKVANSGTFVLNDWMFGSALQGTFWAFNKAGSVIIKEFFSANMHNNGLSPDGRYAVCQCLHSETEDANVVAFFDTERGIMLWKRRPETGCAQTFDFDLAKEILILNYRDLGSFRYSFYGAFLDADAWNEKRIERASAFDLALMARRKIKESAKSLSAQEAKELLDVLRRALQKGLDEYPSEKARVYKSIGEVYETLGKPREAIVNFQAALKLDPKVGLKRRLSELQKQ